MTYWSLYYHCIWTTRDRAPLLDTTIRPQVHAMIAARVRESTGRACYVGGTANHVHMLCSIPPRIPVSEMMKDVKGSSSRFIAAPTSVCSDQAG